MDSKTLPFKPAPEAVDIWINTSRAEKNDKSCENENKILSSQGENMKRFTIDVSEDLHKRIKAQCAMRGVKMAEVMREILEHEFPKG